MAKKTPQDVQREVEQRLREIELLEKEARQQGLAFSAIDEETLKKKVQAEGGKTPYIYSMSWTSGTPAGSAANFRVYVSNPDPVGYYPVFASIFFKVANFLDNQSFGLAASAGSFNGDGRWPYLSSAPFSLASGATANQAFTYTTPTGVPPSTYIGNVVVWKGEFHDQGQYFDRGLFPITLT